jgi:hypothetical protein
MADACCLGAFVGPLPAAGPGHSLGVGLGPARGVDDAAALGVRRAGVCECRRVPKSASWLAARRVCRHPDAARPAEGRAEWGARKGFLDIPWSAPPGGWEGARTDWTSRNLALMAVSTNTARNASARSTAALFAAAMMGRRTLMH